MRFRLLIGGRRTLCRITLCLALCLPMLRSVAAASLDGTYDFNGSTHLTKYDLNGNIISNGSLGPDVQFNLATLTYIPDSNIVPEPPSFTLLAFGLMGLGIGVHCSRIGIRRDFQN